MPKCINCNTLLPPDFLEDTADGMAKRCLFCAKGTSTIEYYSEKESKQMKITKEETAKEYVEFLREISEMPSVSDVIDAIKEREGSHI